MIRVVLVEDQVALHGAMRAFLERRRDVEVVAVLPDGRSALESVPVLKPDVVVLDVMLPDIGGVEVTRRLRSAWPQCRIVAWTGGHNWRVVHDLKAAGVCGFARKGATRDDLHEAIRAVARGECYFASDVDPEAAPPVEPGGPERDPLALTPRELEVLEHLARGAPMKEVAFALGLSVDMIEHLRKCLFIKLGVDDLAGLVKYAVQIGLTPLD